MTLPGMEKRQMEKLLSAKGGNITLREFFQLSQVEMSNLLGGDNNSSSEKIFNTINRNIRKYLFPVFVIFFVINIPCLIQQTSKRNVAYKRRFDQNPSCSLR